MNDINPKTQAQREVLKRIKKMPQSEIAKELGVSRQNVSSIVKALIENGFLKKDEQQKAYGQLEKKYNIDFIVEMYCKHSEEEASKILELTKNQYRYLLGKMKMQFPEKFQKRKREKEKKHHKRNLKIMNTLSKGLTIKETANIHKLSPGQIARIKAYYKDKI